MGTSHVEELSVRGSDGPEEECPVGTVASFCRNAALSPILVSARPSGFGRWTDSMTRSFDMVPHPCISSSEGSRFLVSRMQAPSLGQVAMHGR
jgi:hypothetical protein